MARKLISAVALILALLTAISALASCGGLSSSKEEQETVLKIGEYSVPYELYRYVALNFRKDFPDASEEDLREKTLSALLDIYAVIAAAKEYSLTPDDDFFKEAADNASQLARDEAGGKSEYKKKLAESFMNDSVYRFLSVKDVLSQELYYAMVNKGDIDDSAENLVSLFQKGEIVCVKQILITTEDSTTGGEVQYTPAETHTDDEAARIAADVREKALAGESFDTLVDEYGESFYMFRNTDGYYLCRGMWEDENENAVFALGTGDISEVVKSDAGYSVFMRCEGSADYVKNNAGTIGENYGRGVYTVFVEKMRESLTVEKTEKYEELKIKSLEMN